MKLYPGKVIMYKPMKCRAVVMWVNEKWVWDGINKVKYFREMSLRLMGPEYSNPTMYKTVVIEQHDLTTLDMLEGEVPQAYLPRSATSSLDQPDLDRPDTP